MGTVSPLDGIELNAVDWVETPQSVQELVLRLLAENRELKTRLSWLEEQTKQNSQNSSRPPSGDGFGKKKPHIVSNLVPHIE